MWCISKCIFLVIKFVNVFCLFILVALSAYTEKVKSLLVEVCYTDLLEFLETPYFIYRSRSNYESV